MLGVLIVSCSKRKCIYLKNCVRDGQLISLLKFYHELFRQSKYSLLPKRGLVVERGRHSLLYFPCIGDLGQILIIIV